MDSGDEHDRQSGLELSRGESTEGQTTEERRGGSQGQSLRLGGLEERAKEGGRASMRRGARRGVSGSTEQSVGAGGAGDGPRAWRVTECWAPRCRRDVARPSAGGSAVTRVVPGKAGCRGPVL